MSTNAKNKNRQIEEMLEKEVPKHQLQNDLESEISSSSKVKEKDLIKNVNNLFLINILSPEVLKNEKAKRHHKFILIALMIIFLIIQFRSVYVISEKVIEYATNKDASVDIVKFLLTFVSGYITSVVVELIAILKYIVKNVFDTSIAELVKIFKETDSIGKEQDG